MPEIHSQKELNEALTKAQRTYLLLYKKGEEKSDCAFTHFMAAGKDVKDVLLLYANVAMVRDIHTTYGITTAPALLEFEQGRFKNQIKGCQTAGHYQALFEEAVYHATAPKDETPSKRVTVYSTPTCSWCNTLKAYLKKNHIYFTDIDVSRDSRAADELVRRSGQTGVPQTDINGELIVGFDKARINRLLGIQG